MYGRWQCNESELAYFQERLKDRSPRGLLKGPTRTQKLLEALKLGPIPQTEDVDGLLQRAKLGELQEWLVPLPPGLGWQLAVFPPPPDLTAARIGRLVHIAVEREYRRCFPARTVVFDSRVHFSTYEKDLGDFSSADPQGDPFDFRLRMAFEAFKAFKGDQPGPFFDLRADIFDATTLEIWEIKPRQSASMGAVQSWLYESRFNATWAPYAVSQIDPDRGFAGWGHRWPERPLTVDLSDKYRAVIKASIVPGLIVYDVFERSRKSQEESKYLKECVPELVRRMLEREAQQPILIPIPGQLPGQLPEPVRPPIVAPGPAGSPEIPQESGTKGTEGSKPAQGEPANDNVEGEGAGQQAAKDLNPDTLMLVLQLMAAMALFLLTLETIGAQLKPAPATGLPIGPFDGVEPRMPLEANIQDRESVRRVLLAIANLQDMGRLRGRGTAAQPQV